MPRISQEIIDQIKQNVDIVDVIGQYIPLSKRGSNYMASCPFHEDRNPSFSVSQSKQIFKCFSCGRGGNVFTFLEGMEGLSFLQAVKKAAEFSSIKLDAEIFAQFTDEKNEENPLLKLLEKTHAFYHYYLTASKNGRKALDYLKARQVKDSTIERFGLGLAPDNSELLEAYLLKEGFNQESLKASGVFYQTEEGSLLDRFRGRLIIPLRDRQGRTVAFAGRIYQAQDRSLSKYINSPETAIFQKKNLLFNLDLARLSIRQKHQAIICEGYMDVMAMDQAGFENVVASMGTSLTLDHLRSLSRLTKAVIFLFDGDEAGQKATAHAFEIASQVPQIQAKAVSLGQGLDPDEWIKERGQGAFEEVLARARSQYEFMADYLKQSYHLDQDQDKSHYIEKMIEQIAQLSSPIEQALRVQDLANQFELSPELIQEQLAWVTFRMQERAGQSKPFKKSGPEANTLVKTYDPAQIPLEDFKVESVRAYQSEKQILFNLIHYEEAWKFVESLDHPLVFYHETAQNIYFELQKLYYDEGNLLPLTAIIDRMTDKKSSYFLTDLLWKQEKLAYREEVMADSLRMIHKAFLEKQVEELKNKAKEAGDQQDFTGMNAYMLEIMNLTRQLKA